LRSCNVSLRINSIGERSLARSHKQALPPIKKSIEHRIKPFEAHDEFISSEKLPIERLEEAMEKILEINIGKHKERKELDISYNSKSDELS
jgi:hypothetical protein